MLAPPLAKMGVASVANGDAWPGANPGPDIDELLEPETDVIRKCGEAIVGEGHKFAGVGMAMGEDCGVGSKLPGWLRFRLIGGYGQMTVLHAVVGTLCGVMIGLEPGDAAGPGAAVQAAVAPRGP